MTRSQVVAAMAKSMREFGYPDVTDRMADEVFSTYVANPDYEMPHGVIGMFMQRQLDELSEAGVDLAALREERT